MIHADQRPHAVRFAMLMPWGRVGSNLILHIIDQTKRFRIFNEVFTSIQTQYRARSREEVSRRQKLWFDEFYSGLETDHRSGGAKFTIASTTDLPWFTQSLVDRNLKVIYMDRRNLVKTAYSVIRAEAYTKHHKEKYGTSAWAVRSGRELNEQIHVDVPRFTRYLEFCRENQLLLAELRERVPGIHVMYEDIMVDLDGVVSVVLNYLECDMFEYKIPFVKSSKDDLRAEISNFDELLKSLRNDEDRKQLVS